MSDQNCYFSGTRPFMFADAAGDFINIVLFGTLGVIALILLVLFASRSAKYRLLVIAGSSFLIGIGSILFALCFSVKSPSLRVMLLSFMPVLVGCLGLFRSSKRDKRKLRSATTSDGEEEDSKRLEQER